eukprot:6893075-Alexandrium_andersonii.AAC.1
MPPPQAPQLRSPTWIAHPEAAAQAPRARARGQRDRRHSIAAQGWTIPFPHLAPSLPDRCQAPQALPQFRPLFACQRPR